MQLNPYLFFPGNCEEALNFYKDAFGGEITTLMRHDDPNMNFPEEQKNKIMHAVLTVDENTIMFSDGMAGEQVDFGNGIYLNLSLNDEARMRKCFGALAEGGKVITEIRKEFWGALFGLVRDRYGINWMFNCAV
jgi:PhnB protein